MVEYFETCPECDSRDTECLHGTRLLEEYEEVWVCNDCPTEWVVSFGNPVIEETL